MNRITVSTRLKVDFQDITSLIQGLVGSSRVGDGLCYLFVPHTTAGITVNESADPSVAADICAYLESIVPSQRDYRHLEGNAPAHIKASLVGSCQVLPVQDGRLVLGTWQGIFLCEFDGPRRRTVVVKIVPDRP